MSIATTHAARPIPPLQPGDLGRAGPLRVRLAEGQADIEACQRLRYQVFYEEMSAKPVGDMAALGLDFDQFDEVADHLMVIDSRTTKTQQVVGTYRLLRGDVANEHGGFYTAGEYDIAPMMARAPKGTRFLELGRSCVHADYRTRPTINLLWQGLGHYIAEHKIDAMFGCASFPGTDPEEHSLPLSYLRQKLAAPEQWQVRAREELFVEMNRMAAGQIDRRAAMRALPPLIRGYVHAGCFFGDGAVIDHQFSTVDVFVMCVIADVADRYFNRFGAAE